MEDGGRKRDKEGGGQWGDKEREKEKREREQGKQAEVFSTWSLQKLLEPGTAATITGIRVVSLLCLSPPIDTGPEPAQVSWAGQAPRDRSRQWWWGSPGWQPQGFPADCCVQRGGEGPGAGRQRGSVRQTQGGAGWGLPRAFEVLGLPTPRPEVAQVLSGASHRGFLPLGRAVGAGDERIRMTGDSGGGGVGKREEGQGGPQSRPWLSNPRGH